MDDFMGSPVLGAIAEGVVVATKHAADLATDDDGEFLWDTIGENDEPLTPEEQEVAIEFVFRNSSNKDEKDSSENLQVYIYGLVVLIVLMVIFVIGICCYNRYVIKINIERTQQLQHEFQEGVGYDRRGSENNRRMPMQYDPKADVDELFTGIGATNDGRHSSRPLTNGRHHADTDYGTVEPPTTHTKKKEADESFGQNLSYKRNRDDLNDSGALPSFE